ncbi:MAG: hypothetical protein Q9186_001693 [Xanthomendoza sp. 1 TL-2023]
MLWSRGGTPRRSGIGTPWKALNAMASSNPPPPRTPFRSSASSSAATPSFLQQRDALIGEISIAMEHVLQNINRLNRNLEGVIAVGNEFGAVEALWSQFENVMAKEPGSGEDGTPESRKGEEEVREEGGRHGDGKEVQEKQ